MKERSDEFTEAACSSHQRGNANKPKYTLRDNDIVPQRATHRHNLWTSLGFSLILFALLALAYNASGG